MLNFCIQKKEAVEEPEMDPDVAALMGFGGFRSSNKKWHSSTCGMSCVKFWAIFCNVEQNLVANSLVPGGFRMNYDQMENSWDQTIVCKLSMVLYIHKIGLFIVHFFW